jgi:hypothetical protein
VGIQARELCTGSLQHLEENSDVEMKLLKRKKVHYLPARSWPRRQKEQASQRRQRWRLANALHKLQQRIEGGRLKKRDNIIECVGTIKGRFPKARIVVTINVCEGNRPHLSWSWDLAKYRTAVRADGAYLLRSNQGGWTAEEFWETYIQLTVVEHAFRVLKSELLLWPVWHHYAGRTQAHVIVCVPAYALWKTLDYLAKQAGLETEIRKPDLQRPRSSPKPRPMTPEVILRELGDVAIGDILLETTVGRELSFDGSHGPQRSRREF